MWFERNERFAGDATMKIIAFNETFTATYDKAM